MGVEAGLDARPVSIAETSEAPKNNPIVESEEFEAYETRQWETCFAVMLEAAIARPGVVTSCRDHCQDSVTGGVEGVLLSTRAGRRFSAALSENGKGTTTTSQRSQITERLVIFLRPPLLEGFRNREMVGSVVGLDPAKDHGVALLRFRR